MDELKKIYNKLLNKIFFLMARGILKSITDSNGIQRLNMTCLQGEYLIDIEKLEQYGFSSQPLPGAETFTLFMGGNRDMGISICAHDSRYRPTYMASSEVCLYTSRDKTIPHRILLKADGTIQIYGTTLNVTGDVTASGDVSDSSGTAQTMAAMRTIFNAHVHTCAAPGNPSSPPTTSM